MPNKLEITRSDGVVLELPNINVTNATNCTHTVSVDGMPMEITYAVRYLLADRERILTLLADAKAAKDV